MKASELIASLQDAIAKHGDLPVAFDWECYTSSCEPVKMVETGSIYRVDGEHYWGPYLSVGDA